MSNPVRRDQICNSQSQIGNVAGQEYTWLASFVKATGWSAFLIPDP
jgi:hypothetical protein